MSTSGVVDGHTKFSPYGYTPSAAANISFLATFRWEVYWNCPDHSILTIFHLVLGVKYRTWYFMTAMLLGGLGITIAFNANWYRRTNRVRRSRRVSLRRDLRHLLHHPNLLSHLRSRILLSSPILDNRHPVFLTTTKADIDPIWFAMSTQDLNRFTTSSYSPASTSSL